MSQIMYGQYVVPPAEQLVKFNVGQPSPNILPLDMFKNAFQNIMLTTDPNLLQYGNIPGYDKFRESLAEFLSKQYTQPVNHTDLFVTNGITHAITFFCSLFMHKGSTVFVEEPTYFLAINIFKELELNIVSIPIQHDGIDIDALTLELNKCDPLDNRTKLLYTIPTFHNPTSYTMSNEKRIMLAKLVESRSDLLILADEVYQMLYFSESSKPPKPMCYYTDKAISMGSFSKILAPALRLGWIHTKNKDIMNKLLKSGQYDSSGGTSPISQKIAHEIILAGNLEVNIMTSKSFLKNNCKYLSKQIRNYLSEFVDFIEPSGGYFIWLKVKDIYKVRHVLDLSETYKIMLAPGEKFSADGGCANYFRLSFSYYDLNGINIGIGRLWELFMHLKNLNSNKTKIAILGHNGKLGSKIVQNLNNYEFDNSNDNRSTDITFIEGIDRNFDMKNLDFYSVIIDVSSPKGTKLLIETLIIKNKYIPLVIGTTGDLPMNLIREYSKLAPVTIVSNFSTGVPNLIKILEQMNFDGWDLSMIEKHHVHKIDKPSGTALTLQKASGHTFHIESIREGEIIGDHIITLDKQDEQIKLEHHAKNRELFANGAIECCKWIIKQKCKLYYGMEQYKLAFSKYSGCGNDFIMIDIKESIKYGLETDNDKQVFVIKYCKRGLSIGADGVIFINLKLEPNTIGWQYYNSDGSCVEMCGNGARCTVQYAIDNGFVLTEESVLKNNFDIVTRIIRDCESNTFSICVVNDLGKDVEKYYLPDSPEKYIIKINVAVPHIVFSPDTFPQKFIEDPKICYEYFSDKFSSGTNVNTNTFVLKNEKIHIRTYERGVWEETLACGTGCCAVAYYYHVCHNNNKETMEYEFIVKSGESMFVKLVPNQSQNGFYQVFLRGPANKIFEGFI
jgi:2-aminoadipate transaminase